MTLSSAVKKIPSVCSQSSRKPANTSETSPTVFLLPPSSPNSSSEFCKSRCPRKKISCLKTKGTVTKIVFSEFDSTRKEVQLAALLFFWRALSAVQYSVSKGIKIPGTEANTLQHLSLVITALGISGRIGNIK